MADRQFNIEVLIKARNAASQAMRDLARDSNKADENVKKLSSSSKDASKNVDKLGENAGKAKTNLADINKEFTKFNSKLPDINERLKIFSRETLTVGNRLNSFGNNLKEVNKQSNRVKANLDNAATAQRNLNTQTRSLTDVVKALNTALISKIAVTEGAEGATTKNTHAVRLKKAALDNLKAATEATTEATKKKQSATEKASGATSRHAQVSRSFARDLDRDGNILSRFADRLLGISTSSNSASSGLRELALNARGLVLAFVIKYAQVLTSALVGLGGEAVAVASAFVSAGAAIGGAFTSGVLQAIPVVGLLIASLTRAAKVLEALNLTQQIKQRGGTDGRADAQAAQADIDRIANAQEGLADANRSLSRAQDDLTKARAEGRRELQDLILAERQAELAARGAVLSQEEAQRALRAALERGDQAEIARARLNVASSRTDLTQRRQETTRARVDARQGRSGGVEGLERVVSARRAVADAERRAAASTRDLARAQDKLADSGADATAQEDRLAFMLKQLSPSEIQLLKAIQRFQATYKKEFRGITDIIVDSFTRSVERAESVLKDNRIITAARDLATKLASSIDSVGKFATGERSKGFLAFLSKEAEFNLTSITKTLVQAAKAIFNIGEAAAPLFRFIIDKVGDVVDKLEFSTRGNRGAKFFASVQDDLESILDLVREVGRFFDAIFAPARKAGRSSLDQLTEDLTKFDRKLEASPKKVEKFFSDSNRIFRAFAEVVGALGVELFKAFNPDSVEDFADVIKDIFIPALGNAIRLMGLLTRSLQILLDLPVVRELAQFAFSVFLFTKSIQVLRGAAASLVGVFAALFGAGSKGLPAFSPIIRLIVILGAAFFTLKNIMERLNIEFDSLEGKVAILATGVAFAGLNRLLGRSSAAFKAYRTVVAVQTASAAGAVVGFSQKSSAAINGLKAAFRLSPFGILITGISLAAAALSLFIGQNNKTKNSVEDLTDALERQTDAYRALRDAALDQKDANLAVQNAEIRLANAKARVVEITKENRKDGKLTAQELRDEKQAKLDVTQSELDLTRARRRSKDIKEDNVNVEKKAREESKTTLKQAKENVAALKEERSNIKDKIVDLKENIKFARKSGDKAIEIANTKELNKEEDKLKDTNKKLKNANGELNQSLRTAGRTFVRLKGNAEDFGLTFSDVLGFLEKGANSALGSFGAKKVNFATKYIRSEIDHIPNFTGDVQGRAQGGFLGGSGLMDSIPVLAAPGEAVINRHQIPFVDSALRSSGIMEGGLQELFSRVQTPHFMAKGGYVQQAAENGGGKFLTSQAKNFAEKMFGLGFNVTSAFRPGDPRQHGKGQALDFGDSVNDMRRLWSYVFPVRKQFNQLLGPYGLFNGLKKFADPGLQADHRDHIHVGFGGKDVTGVGALLNKIGRVSIKSNVEGFTPRLLRAMEKKVRSAGDKYIDKQIGGIDTFDRQFDTKRVKGQLSGNQVKTFASRAIGLLGINKQKEAWIQMLAGRAYQESTFNPNAINRTDINAQRGDPSRGLMQITGSNFKRYAFGGRTNINNPFDNMLASIAYMLERYGKGDPITALQAMLRRNAAKQPYARGGFIRAASGANFAASQSQAISSSNAAVAVAIAKAKAGKVANSIFGLIAEDLREFTQTLRSGNKKEIAKALRDLTDSSDGIIARFTTQFEEFSTLLANKLKASSIRIKGKKVTKILSDVEIARGGIENLRDEQAALVDQRNALLKAEKVARRKGNRKAAKALRNSRLDIEAQIADKLQEIQDATDEVFNTLSENITGEGNRVLGSIDRARRLKSFTGQRGFASQEQAALTQQQAQLSNLLANSPGISADVRHQMEDTIAELGVQILEKAHQAIEEELADVEASAASGARSVGLKNRLADLVGRRTAGGGVAAARLRGGALQQERGNLVNERLATQRLLSLAQGAGDTELAKTLQEKIADLNVQLEENKVAIQENTDSIQTLNINNAIDKNSFTGGAISQAISNIQAFGNLAGNAVNNSLIGQLIQSNIKLDNSTIRNLKNQLAPLLKQLGINPNQLLSASSPEALSGILAQLAGTDTGSLTPAQQENFRNLINTLLGLTGSVLGLQQQMEDLSNNLNPQSFATTAWTLFNRAIFNGDGALLPQFANLIPQMHTGGLVTKGGLFNLQAGEKVTDKQASKTMNDTTHQWYVTSPTEIADPDYLATVMSFKLSTSGAVR